MTAAPPGPRYRFAPSPTGFFHVGGARTALYNWALAKQSGGTFVLRIEDTDEARNQPEWTQGIVDALAWIGIHPDDPTFEGPYFQSEYATAHVSAALRLHDAGNAYYCDMTPEEVQARAKAEGRPGYGGWSRDRGLGPGPGRVLRFRTPDDGVTVVHDAVRGEVEFANETLEDFVLLRGNGTPVFLIANVVDDVEMRISHVLRAEEHLPNTPKQQLLWEALGHRPPAWAHVPVLVNEQRKKLSKRRDKVAMEQYRAEGYVAEAMVNYLMTLGWAPKGETEIVPWAVIERDFRLEDVNHSPAFFDLKKLAAFNGEYLRAMPTDEFVAACQPFVTASDVPWPADRFDPVVFAAMAPLVQTRVVTLADVVPMVDFLFLVHPVIDEAAWAKARGLASARPLFDAIVAAFEALPVWDEVVLKEAYEAACVAHGYEKVGKPQGLLRIPVTGRAVGPPIYEALVLLGRDEVLRRLHAVARPSSTW